jgi:hypothetical protein
MKYTIKEYMKYKIKLPAYLFLVIIYILRTFFHYNQADSVLPHSTSYPHLNKPVYNVWTHVYNVSVTQELNNLTQAEIIESSLPNWREKRRLNLFSRKKLQIFLASINGNSHYK